MKQAAAGMLLLGMMCGCLLKPFAECTNSDVDGQLQNILDPAELGTARARGSKARVRAEKVKAGKNGRARFWLSHLAFDISGTPSPKNDGFFC